MAPRPAIASIYLVIGIAIFCISTGIVGTAREFYLPTYSGFRFHQPMKQIPLHFGVAFAAAGVAQLLAFVIKCPPLASKPKVMALGSLYGAIALTVLLLEREIPSVLDEVSKSSGIISLFLVAAVACSAFRLVLARIGA